MITTRSAAVTGPAHVRWAGLALGDHTLEIVQEACANESLPAETMWRTVEPLRQ